MSKHKQVVKETLTYFYSRIQAPKASGKERLRIARLALDQLEPEAPTFSLDGMTVAQVQTAVEGGKVSAEAALEHESANAGRKTLIGWLEERAE